MNLYMKVKYLCVKGDIVTVAEMITKGVISKLVSNDSLMWGLYGACYGGHIELINLLIEHGANNWDYGLMGACEGGRYDVIFMMTARGASNFNMALDGACASGNIDVINIILTSNRVDINYALRGACMSNKKHVVELAIQRGANDWNIGMITSCQYGHLDLVKLMISLGATEWNKGLYSACMYGYLDIIYLMIEMGANNFNDGLMYACVGFSNIDTVKLMILLGGNNWSAALEHAYKCMNFDVVKLLLDSSRGSIQSQNLQGLQDCEDVRMYSLYCKYSCDGEGYSIDPHKDDKFNRLLSAYPPYVVLLSKITHNTQCCVSKLPYELHRLLHECFYNFTTDRDYK